MQEVKIPKEKRIFDIAVSLLAIVLFSPVIVLIFAVMLLEKIFLPQLRKNIFYKEVRFSAGKPFKIYKFNIFKEKILREAGQQQEIVQTKKLEIDKNNLTPIGRFLKQVYLDELPQAINVLKGEMSLVGPRPVNALCLDKLKCAGHLSKFLIRAGITGYFQSHKGPKYQEMQEDSDMRYVLFCQNNPGWKIILYDAKIIILSVLTVLRAEGI